MQENQTDADSRADEKDSLQLRREAKAFIWETLKIVIISLAIIIPIRYFVVQPFFVRGASMQPNFQNNDYILIDEISYRFKSPSRGEVVVFRSPEDTAQFFIKRIIGLPGETIQIRDGQVRIFNEQEPQGIVLSETYLPDNLQTDGVITVKVDPNEYFVMGDNRPNSSDSRRWGPVNTTLITGRVLVRVWPLSDFGHPGLPTYNF
ncbi:MAG: signal peptidase I [Candidatus Yanofskybacteria bacterium CG10_big_fil_rev_8_21_14_0_10_46_23]|uniref:Signal peptidase I n=1 Tax=Candidatus Yanofskybacteria bacterium CG10_big_fil_rev_8_21_14_0_10_46_23 TaxID=1975098 RepID=A0A2H0R3N5_9BACT|nr:MAG: signal peptidase I [Candidatus Yanofskybacteria bacterium CG10_big_fil_rev_8_21_14_0_10_46_23]